MSELSEEENQSLFEAYNFNDTNLLSKILKEYRKEIEELKKENDLYKKTKQLFENDLLGYIKGYEDGRNGSTGLAYKVGKEFADYTLSLQLNRYKESYIGVRKELDNAISKDKIREKIEDLEKEQEDNRKKLYNAVNNLIFKEIDKISDRISVNMTVRGILQSLLKEE